MKFEICIFWLIGFAVVLALDSGDVRNENQINPSVGEEVDVVEEDEEEIVKPRYSSGGCPARRCPVNTIPVNNRCYRFVNTYQNWTNAQKECAKQGGYLAIPEFPYNYTLTDLSVVYREIGSFYYLWIGGCNNMSTIIWKWVDGTILPNNHPHWEKGQPSGNDQCTTLFRMIDGPLTIVQRPFAEIRQFLYSKGSEIMKCLVPFFVLIISNSVFTISFENPNPLFGAQRIAPDPQEYEETPLFEVQRMTPDPQEYDEFLNELSLSEIRVPEVRTNYPPGCPSLCPLHTVLVFDRCYRWVSSVATWPEAKKDCEGQGGILAIPNFSYNNTAVDLAAVYRTIIGTQFIWIGATDNYSQVDWKWVDGKVLPRNHPNWYPNHPGQVNNCATIHRMVKGPLHMHERPCLEKRSFLCQFKFLNKA